MKVLKTRVTQGGRIVIPADVRKRLGIEVGGSVNLVIEDDESIRLSTPQHALRRAQEHFRKHVPEGVSLVDELIAERRREAANE